MMLHKLVLVPVAGAVAYAILPIGAASSADQVVVTRSDQVKWMDAPQVAPGAKIVVLSGDPNAAQPYVMRLMVPANTMVPAHTHGETEDVTVISGSLGVGLGEKSDKAKGQQLAAGSFVHLPANTPHFAWADRETVVQINGMGPSTMQVIEATGSSSK